VVPRDQYSRHHTTDHGGRLRGLAAAIGATDVGNPISVVWRLHKAIGPMITVSTSTRRFYASRFASGAAKPGQNKEAPCLSTGKVMLSIGASNGIGEATARALATRCGQPGRTARSRGTKW
jgi:hypothetical protein